MTSLVASLAIRFLWIRLHLESQSQLLPSYEQYLLSAGVALVNTLAPACVALAVVYGLVWRRFRTGQSEAPAVGWLALSGFYASMTALSLLAHRGFTFLPETWLIAWGVGLAAHGVSELTRRMGADSKDRIVYSRPTQLVIDGAVVAISWALAYWIRFDGSVPAPHVRQFLSVAGYAILIQIGVSYLWGVYAFIWRFTGLREAIVIAESVASVTLGSIALRIAFLDYPPLRVPFGVLLIQPVLVYTGFLGVRTLRRLQYSFQVRRRKGVASEETKRLLLVGAGRAGQLLVRELEHLPGLHVLGFLDDDPRKQRRVINGVRVLGPTTKLKTFLESLEPSEVTLSMPSAPKSVAQRIVTVCEEAGVRVSTVPSLAEIALGRVSISRLRRVKMEDLLGRASIEYAKDDSALFQTYRDATILVTGAAGSIGSELVRQLREFGPGALIMLDKDENGLYEIGLETRETFGNASEVIADIRDKDRLRQVFSEFRPQVVFHAAAYKHVPLMELHPCEAILNNVVGSRNVVDLAAEFAVRSFVLVSTDKAVNPTNVMGASKRIAETIVQRRASDGGPTRFCCVRFGNVLGSRASVVPLFQRQIREGRNITVTHPDVQRYFMTIPEAVQLVIQAGSLGRRGEIFVLDMGDPVKIVDLARGLIELSGLVLDRDISIEFTGLRPGEKMFEELLIGSESGIRNTRYPKIFVAAALWREWPRLDQAVQLLESAAREGDAERIYSLLNVLDIGYVRPTPEHSATTPVAS